MSCCRVSRAVYLCVVALLASTPAWGQAPSEAPGQAPELIPPPAWAFNDLACAPSLETAKPGSAPAPLYRVIGSQDTVIRDLLGPGDTLVISGGSNAGLEAGQRFFVRRRMTAHGVTEMPTTVHTAGWVQILGVDTALATATVLHACDGILLDDYLEPFIAPTIAARAVPGSTPQYENMGRIMTGIEGLQTAAAGQVMTINRGSNAGVVPGQRFLVFRDKRDQRVESTGRSQTFATATSSLPLVEIGEVLVVAVRPDDATVQVLGSKDAVTMGDLIAPIR